MSLSDERMERDNHMSDLKRKVVFLPYDFDTAIATNNEGALVFNYNLEDIDQTESGADVFNGQQSVLWKNVRAAFFKELAAMYQTLRSTGALSYERVEKMFEDHQAKWPEAIFNEDAWFKYLAPLVQKGNASYLSMLQGSKAEQRRWWLYNRFRYIDSKYNAGDALTDVITVRGYAKSDITVTPYADIYASVKYGSYLVQSRAPRNIPCLLECPLDNVNDTEIMIFSSSQLASVGDLSGLMVGYADFSNATRLQSLKLGDADPSYSNANLTELYLGNNELLRVIDVRNCPALATSVMLSGCSNIEHVYFEGTSITGLDLPNGGILKTLHLPSTVTNLTIRNQRQISDFVLAEYSNITTLRLENVSNAVDSREILEELLPASRVRLIGVDWTAASYEEITTLFDLLDTMRGLDENGGNVDKAQVSGSIHVPEITSDQIRTLHSRYADLTIDATTTYYNVRFFDGVSDEPIYTTLAAGGAEVADPVASGTIHPPYRASSGRTAYEFTGWNRSLLITGDTDLVAVYSESEGFIMTFKNWDNTTLIEMLVAPGATCPDPVSTGLIPSPTRPADASYVYTYLGWQGASLNNVQQDRTLTARYSTATAYTVRFVNWDGTTLYTYYVSSGATVADPITVGFIETPVRPEDTTNQRVYEYTGWSGSLTNITSSRTITATFRSTQYYYAIFKGYDGAELFRERWNANASATDPVLNKRQPAPTKPSDTWNYTYWKWDRTFPFTITANTTTTALFRSDEEFTVTFKDYDGSVLDTQIVTQHMAAVDPVTSGKIARPVRPSTAQYSYSYNGWNTSFSDVTANLTVTARYTQSTRYYAISFYDSQTLMKSQSFAYNSIPSFTGTPTKTGVEDPNAYYLYSWNPAFKNVTGEQSYYAVWRDVCTDTWSQVIAACQDGTYSSKYAVGNIMWLDLGAQGKLAMQLVGIDKDVDAEGNTVPLSFIALGILASKHHMGFAATEAQTVSYSFQEITGQAAGTKLYRSTNRGVSGRYSASADTFTVTANEDLDIQITAWCEGEPHWDMMHVWVGEDHLADCLGNYPGESVSKTYHMAAGETLSVFAQYVKDTNTDGGQDRGDLTFYSSGSYTVSSVRASQTRPYGGYTEGWKGSVMRTWLEDVILPLFPEELKNHVTPVKKISALGADTTVETIDKLWLPSRREYCYQYAYEQEGPRYDGVFNGTVYPVLENGKQVNTYVWMRSSTGANYSDYLMNETGISNSQVNREYGVQIGFCVK